MTAEDHELTVVIADECPLVRLGLVQLLASGKTLSPVAETDSSDEIVSECAHRRPSLAILGLPLAGEGGVELVRRVKRASPATSVMVLAEQPDRELIELLMRAGAQGYLPRRAPLERISEAASAIAHGYGYLGPGLTRTLSESVPPSAESESYASLSSRERQVFHMVVQGRSTQEIANLLNISTKTVENHRRRILHKFGFNRTAELIRYAAVRGLLA
ncbi:MAG: response regulator transcription factor [Gammaproteobacteria bacterium]|jgi:DNA-binding NarL/FixJ family response regulator